MAAELTLIDGEIVEETSLPVLAVEANRYHDEAEQAVRGAVECAWRAGQALIAAKGQCKHGEWLPWLAENFHGSEKTAHRYMTLASNSSCVTNLDPTTSINGALRAISNNGKPRPDPKPKPDIDRQAERKNERQQAIDALRNPSTGRIVPTVIAEVIAEMTKPSPHAAGTLADAIACQWGSWAAFDKDRKTYNTERNEQQQRLTKTIFKK